MYPEDYNSVSELANHIYATVVNSGKKPNNVSFDTVRELADEFARSAFDIGTPVSDSINTVIGELVTGNYADQDDPTDESNFRLDAFYN